MSKQSMSALILLTLFMFGQSCIAQEQPPSDFFPKDFVNRGFEADAGQGILGKKAELEHAQAAAVQQPPPQLQPMIGEGHGEQILSLGLIVNAVQEEHAKENVQELIDLSKEYSLPIKAVYAVGGLAQAQKKLPDIEYLWAKSMGARLRVTLAPPKEYPVHLSPSWIVETARGIVLLDGCGSLRNAINSAGRLELVQTQM